MTNNFERRAAEHLRNGRDIQEIRGLPELTKTQARGVEQALIDKYGLSSLDNKINSISPSNPIYQNATVFGKNIIDGLGL